MIGIEYPIIKEGWHGLQILRLQVTVSNAGGLGIVACGHAPNDVVKGFIEEMEPFNRQTI